MANKSPGEIVESLLAEFNRELVQTGRPDYGILERCPEAHRQELRTRMRELVSTYQEQGRQGDREG